MAWAGQVVVELVRGTLSGDLTAGEGRPPVSSFSARNLGNHGFGKVNIQYITDKPK